MKLRIPRRVKSEDEDEDLLIEEESQNSTSTIENTDNSQPATIPAVPPATRAALLVSYDGLNSGMSGISGVPTRTTSTLTPTTLRNIDQTFIDFQNETIQSTPYQAGFVPPQPISSSNQLTTLTNTLPSYQLPHHQQQQQNNQQFIDQQRLRLQQSEQLQQHQNFDSNQNQQQQQQQQQQHSQQQNIPQFLIEHEGQSMESLETSSMSDNDSWHTGPPATMDDMNNSNSSQKGLKGRPRSSYASPGSSSSNSNVTAPPTKRRNAGGRKPNKPSNLSPEEEEKRRVRRERNKLAAARCRRRREDHTQELTDETDGLELKKKQYQEEITQLNREAEELLLLLETHKANNQCNVGETVVGRQSPPDVKPNVNNGKIMSYPTNSTPQIVAQRPTSFLTNPTGQGINNNNNNNFTNANRSLKIKTEPLDFYDDSDEPPRKRIAMLSGQEVDITTPTTPYLPQGLITPTFKTMRPRPSSLNVASSLKPSDLLARKNVADLAGVSVLTPSTGMFNFDSLMDGGTGLTPTTNPLIPCSTQNRNPMEMLQTPTSEQSKLVSL